ncbi:DUF5924 family protein [Metapseudomonas boanensis]|uniref:DUF2914 domain-containing protein n=1 Tax=Metapseudomonas boanensis TaxID=2822138 RepID=A0ABS5XIA5_9GAMM|nr:DUF5924 family protein [Pseudomonas boanensis]MBT8767422.1 DUF2914 domain-containing protein [Pseudomonas boanensis]
MPLSTYKPHVLKLIALIQRHPRLIALYGFCSGVASFLLVDRGARVAKVIAILMLVSWVWLVLEHLFRRSIERLFGIEMPPPLMRFLTQLIHQESLFFVLPFFLITTSWNSGQALFTGLLAVAALCSITDPVYNKFLAPRRWLFLAYHTLTLFAVLLAALPLILQLTTAQSYRWALGSAVALSFASLFGAIRVQRWWRGLAMVGLTLAMGGVGWMTRTWVPPATLWLTEVAVTPELDNHRRTPGEGVKEVTSSELRRKGLYAYTAINAPRGLNERIYHVWRFRGQVVDRIALDINGGREAGYRAWTHKQNFPSDPVGRWQVQVITEAGQMIGTLRFRVTPSELPPKPR